MATLHNFFCRIHLAGDFDTFQVHTVSTHAVQLNISDMETVYTIREAIHCGLHRANGRDRVTNRITLRQKVSPLPVPSLKLSRNALCITEALFQSAVYRSSPAPCPVGRCKKDVPVA